MVEYCIYMNFKKQHEHITVSTMEDVEFITDVGQWYNVNRMDNTDDCVLKRETANDLL